MNKSNRQKPKNKKDDEMLIRSREAMILAVQSFNSPSLKFKTEVFSVLAIIAWTYLLHEFFNKKKNIPILKKNGKTISLTEMIHHTDSPLPNGVKNNLKTIIKIRNEVEHQMLATGEKIWFSIYQACCLNFEKMICDLFDKKFSLQKELFFALQFAKIGFEQISETHQHIIPDHIVALDKNIQQGITAEEQLDPDYKFQIVYTLDNLSENKLPVRFVDPKSAQGKEISNVLVKYVSSDTMYIYKPMSIVEEVNKEVKEKFTMHNHTQAWKLYKIRGSEKKVNKKYCTYNQAHKDYTYSKKWIEFLVKEIANPRKYKKIINFKIS